MMGLTYKAKNTTDGNMPHPFKQDSNRFTRNLDKPDLAGVIFGCKNETKEECLSNQLFGLPAAHFSYVKNISPGLPLFLFNYSERKLYGIFEAVCAGQLNINPYGWTKNGAGKTAFAAQVLIRLRQSCRPMSEDQFAPIIKDNYYTQGKFWFELDRDQVSGLIRWFVSHAAPIVPRSLPKPKQMYIPLSVSKASEAGEENRLHKLDLGSDSIHQNSNGNSGGPNCSGFQDGDRKPSESSLISESYEKEIVYQKFVDLALNTDSSHNSHELEPANENETVTVDDGSKSEVVEDEDVIDTRIAQLMKVVNELEASKKADTIKMILMEQKLVALEAENQLLKNRWDQCSSDPSEFLSVDEIELLDEQNTESDVVFMVGGYDGSTYLSSAVSCPLSRGTIRSLQPMSSSRAHASIAKLNDNFYVVGGGPGKDGDWCDTVESYNTLNDEWTSQPTLNEAKGSLATVTVDNKIFAMGGGDGKTCFSDMQMLDLDVGRWICGRSMRRKRFALGAVALNNVIYAVGGYDGEYYLRSAERFDPREHAWSNIENMNVTRGCHSLVVLNEKIYAIGGFDGSDMVSSVEVFDPRLGKWVLEGSMNHARGYASAVAFGDSIYSIGGVMDDGIIDSVERYEEGKGWQMTSLRGIGKRCYASAIAL